MISTETATRFNREPSKILGEVQRGNSVVIEKNGEPCAIIIPYPRRTSGAEMARRLRRLKPMPEAAKEMEKILKDLDDASRGSYNLG